MCQFVCLDRPTLKELFRVELFNWKPNNQLWHKKLNCLNHWSLKSCGKTDLVRCCCYCCGSYCLTWSEAKCGLVECYAMTYKSYTCAGYRYVLFLVYLAVLTSILREGPETLQNAAEIAHFALLKIWHALVQFDNAPVSRHSRLRHWLPKSSTPKTHTHKTYLKMR